MQYNFFCQNETHTIKTNKQGTFTDIKAFASNRKKKPVAMEQVHGNSFVFLTENPTHAKLPNVDGVLSNNSQLLLTVRTADCLPILLYHPSGIVGAIHAGRKSTQQEILKNVLTFLKKEHTLTNEITLWFGPAICESCYQIDRKTDTHYNLIAENMAQAYTVFQPEDVQIIVNGDCTQCLSNEYHSYRVEQKQVQMNYFGISLK